MTTPNKHIPYVPEGTLDPAAGLNLALNFIDALLQTAVIAMDLNAPPGSPIDDGALYIVAGTGGVATGDWAGHELDLARYVEEGDYWQFFEAGSEASLIINLEDGNLYKWVDGSPPSWVLAAGLGDAPNDGEAYFRQSLSWVQFISPTVEATDGSPATSVQLGALLLGTEFRLTELSPNSGLLQLRGPEVVNTAAVNTDATASNAGQYTRFSDAAATYTFDDAEGFEIGAEYHGRYTGSGTLTITEAGGMTINPPAGGTLVIPPQGTFTVKIVAADEADLFGITEAA
jgi:hypothetical protein